MTNESIDQVPAAYRATEDPEPANTSGPTALHQRSSREEKTGRSRRLEYPPAPQPLVGPIIDNHTHLDFRDGLVEVNVHQAMDAAEQVGVIGAIQVGCNLEAARFTVEAVEAEHRLLGAVAIHPNDAARMAQRGELDDALDEIFTLANHPRIRAVGETGLDYFRTGPDGIDAQKYSFRRHLDMAVRLDKALQIHDRDAHDDVVEILDQADQLPRHVVFHCFSGDASLARICNDRGWMMSFAGPVSFKANDALREAARIARPELMLVETDAPFLTPHPYRGRPNAPYLTPLTLRTLASVRGISEEAMAQTVLENTLRVYGAFDAS
ncbi:TatD family hydrolase [Citricoccus sp. NR2]|uniref:TatD family hydrolase n=1 Tax=Citricoccus sp. NR2 TaxID=3004095 RepID=UPI0022DDDBF0|nr:TatD family hydrolase [Citricoccus sp. NR2]WBL18961.1 TatD family hydrolase [Citricoccus sp. NR2]